MLFHQLSDGSERPIAFASRTLSPAERNYSQIKKESLACVFGVKKFHSYLYGRQFIPTETVLLLQQMSESPISVSQIRTWTRRDPILSRVLQFVLSGWPAELDPSDVSLKPFLTRKLELSTQDGVLLWGIRVIVPPPGQDLILQELHACHPGIARMKTLAWMFVWWPCLDSDIENFVNKCSTCQSQHPTPPAAPICPWKWPTQPWYRLHLDMAGPFLGHMFLVLIDAHSKWLEVRLMPSTTSTAIISTLYSIFAQFGLPSVIVTDNGRNFKC